MTLSHLNESKKISLEHLEAIKQMRSYEQEQINRNRLLIKNLLQIPHLKISIDFDIKKIREEMKTITVLYPHLLHPQKDFPHWYYQKHIFSFQGQCLYDFQRSSETGMSDPPLNIYHEEGVQFDHKSRVCYFPTDTGERTPYTLSVLKKISSYLCRTRFIQTPADGGIPWHSHHNGVYKMDYPRLGIVHVPIESNAKAIHEVRDLKNNNKIVSENYTVGNCYLFNSWHDHQFWNKGNKDRLTLIAYFNLSDPEFLANIKNDILNYNGPLLSAGEFDG